MDSLTTMINKRYVLQEQLGAGGMGVVFRAYDVLAQQDVALKRLNIPTEYLIFSSRLEGADAQSLLLTLANEFQILSSLRHPHIVSVLDYGFDSNQYPYFTMELLPDAQTLLEVAQLEDVDACVEKLIQILQALAYLHRRGVVHRDLKPDNVIVTSGIAKVLDFGLAVSPLYDLLPGNSSSGTITHMAPEVLMGDEADFRSDLYAVGIIAYEMLSGQHPFNPYELDLSAFVEMVTQETPDTSMLPTGYAGVIAKLLAIDPADRYASANEAIRDLSDVSHLPIPLETAEIRESYLQAAEFVGRESELAQLKGAFDSANAGEGTAWLIGGESGVGKSRLISELRTYALVNGAQVLYGQVEQFQDAQYQTWRAIVRWLTIATTLTDIEMAIISEIVPNIATILGRPPVEKLTDLDTEKSRVRLFSTLLALIHRVEATILIVIEDLHWADSHTLELLNWLTRFASEQSLMIVGTFRDDEKPQLAQQLSSMKLLSLQRLLDDDIQGLARSMLGKLGDTPAIIDLIKRETEGNAFFMVEVFRTLAEEFGRLDNIQPEALPDTVFAGGIVAILERRLTHVAPKNQPMLDLAALAGRYLDVAVLATLDTSLNIDTWMLECSESAVLDFDGERWRFSHDKLREALVQRIPAETLGAKHEQIALAIESTYDDLTDYSRQLAHHWAMAGNPTHELKYSIITAEQAQQHFANDEAITYYQRALALDPQNIQLIFALANVYNTISQWDKAIEVLENAVASETDTDEAFVVRARCKSLLGELLARHRGDVDRGLHLLETARAEFEQAGDADGLIRSYSSISSVYISKGDLAQGEKYLEQQITLATNNQSLTWLSNGLLKLGHINSQRGNLTDAEEFYLRALDIAQELDRAQTLASVYFSLGVLYSNLSDIPKALHHYQLLYQKAKQIGDVSLESETIISIGNLYEQDGDFSSAIRCCEYGLMMSSQLDEQLGSSIGLIYLAISLARQGHFTDAVDSALLAIEIVRVLDKKYHLTGYLSIIADILFDSGQYDLALQFSEEASALATAIGTKPYIFANHILSIRIKFALGQHSASDATGALQALLDDPREKVQTAKVHYCIWKIDPNSETSQAQAMRLYQELYESSPIDEYRKYYEALGGDSLTIVAQLPAVDTIITDVDVQKDVYLQRIRRWVNQTSNAPVPLA